MVNVSLELWLHPPPARIPVTRGAVVAAGRVQEKLDVAMLHVSLILAHGPHGVVVRGELHVGLARGPPGVVLQ